MTSSFFVVDKQSATIQILNTWDYTLPRGVIIAFLEQIERLSPVNAPKIITLDFERTAKMDFSAICFLLKNIKCYNIINAKPSILTQVNTFEHYSSKPSKNHPISYKISSYDILKTNTAPKGVFHSISVTFKKLFLKTLPAKIKDFYEDGLNFFNFLGLILFHLYLSIKSPKRFKFKNFVYHINESGFKALPIALLTTFIIGFAITLQAAIQLQKLGVGLIAIDTTAKFSLREVGPFILALIIAGRSSSSFTAQLGSMNIQDEISAMRAMDFNIFDFLVIPRVLALVIVMPLLVFLSDFMAIFSGMIALKFKLGITFEQYLERFYSVVGWENFVIGIVKAPFFGATIALVGTFRGLQDIKDTERLGKSVVNSVINALFWIIIIDAVAILFVNVYFSQ